MFFVNLFSNIIDAGTLQLVQWVTQLLPQIFLFLILLNAVTRLVGRSRVERLAVRCGSNPLLRYLVLPFLSAVILGNPMAISMGRYLAEEYKPAYFASASYHCHTNSGIFQHINPAELFLWLGIANGVLGRGLSLFPLAVRYLCAGLVANFISGYSTEIITRRLEKKQHIRLAETLDFLRSQDSSSDGTGDSGEGNSEKKNADSANQTDLRQQATVPAASALQDTAPEDRADLRQQTSDQAVPVLQDTDPAGKANLRQQASDQAVPALQDTDPADPPYRSITITRGDGGYGGPVTVTPTKDRHIVLYMTGGGMEPEPLEKITALSGMTAVNGNLETCPDEKVALAIIDCGGTLRCGIYPGKGIPTLNLLATGKSGPLAKYMTKDLYVSAVTSGQVSPAFQSTASGANVSSAALLAADTHSTDIPAAIAHASSAHDTNIPAANDSAADMPAADMPAADMSAANMSAANVSAANVSAANVSMDEMSAAEVPEENMTTNGMHAADAAGSSLSASKKEGSASRTSRSDSRSRHLFRRILEPVSFISKVISIFHHSARDAVKTCLDMLLPFMGFAALFIGICRGSGLTVFLAEIMKPMGGSLPGLFLIGILCSIPGLSAILGAGAVAAQIFSTVTGDLILSGSIAPSLALPALFAINCQCACDFIPVGLGMMESKPETMQLGVTSVTLSRFATGWIRILVALVFSIGLYR